MIDTNKKTHIIVTGTGGGGSAEGAVRYDESQTLTSSEQLQARNNIAAISQDDVLNYKEFPAGWHTTGTMADLIADIASDATAVEGKSYMGTVSFSDLPASLVQGEIQIDIMSVNSGLGKNVRFTLTSSNTAPYHWEYTSAYGATGTWRGFVVDSQLATVATTGNYSDLNGTPTIPAAQVNSDWNSNSGVSQILNKPSLATVATTGSYSDLLNKPTILNEWFGTQAQYDLIDPKDPDTIYHIEGGQPLQSDWNEVDNTSLAFIKNKPSIPAAQVNADWNAVSGVAEILNKPTIPAAPVQSDWNEADNTSLAYIANKPSIPAAQVNADWNANSGVAQILNKPSIPAAQVNSDWNAVSGVSQILNKPSTETLTFTLQGGTTVTLDVYVAPQLP